MLSLFASLFVRPLTAQQTAAVTEAANTITAADVARHIGAISADSLGGRDTPSRGLELTARYLAAEFQRLGLTPVGDGGTWFQRYDVPGGAELDRAKSQIVFGKKPGPGEPRRDDPDAVASFATTAWPVSDTLDRNIWRRSIFAVPATTLVTGRQTSQSMDRATLRGKNILYIPPAGLDSLEERQVIDTLRARSSGVVVVAGEDSVAFACHIEAFRRRALYQGDLFMSGRLGGGSWAAYVWPPAVQKLLADVGVDVAALRKDTKTALRDIPLEFELSGVRDMAKGPPPTVPNVVAELTGSDPKLKDEYIVYTAHMDNGGTSSGPGDNAAGTAGLLALAKAFSQPGARSKRSMLFIATSGGAKDWWGLRYVEMALTTSLYKNVVASVHLNTLGHATDDSVVVDGIGDFASLHSPAWLAMTHPELGVTVVDGGPVDRSFDNHGAFVRRTTPSLVFHRRARHEGRSPAASAPMNDAYIARVLRLAFYTGYDMANDGAALRWSADGQANLRRMILND